MSKWPSKIILIRHGQSFYNAAKDDAKNNPPSLATTYRTGGRDQDTPLTLFGEGQAHVTGRYLNQVIQHFGFRRSPGLFLFTSPYVRARKTSDIILSEMTPTPKLIVEDRIREIEFGCLDGLTPHGRQVYYPEEVKRKDREGKYWYRPPGGESRPDVELRLRSFLDTLVRDYHGEHVIIVCHSVVVLTFRRLFERWDEERYLQVDREDDVRNCALTEYEPDVEGKIRLRYYNQYPHELSPEVFGVANV